MPSVMQRKNKATGQVTGPWLIKWKDEHGHWTPWQRTNAPNEKAARKAAQQNEWDCEEIRQGRRPAVVASKPEDEPTVAEICAGFLRERYPRAEDRYIREKQIFRHILLHPFGKLRLSQVVKKVLKEHWNELSEDLEDGTLNRIRTTLLSSFKWAEENTPWKGRNPILAFPPREVPKKARVTLRAEQVPVFLANVPEEWLEFFAAALWSALRKGELCGLLKTNVNLPDRILTVVNSYDKERPKGGDAAAIPIPEPLVPFLESAMARSRSEWLFPDRKGRMRTPDCNPEKILRTALKRAGLVRGYNHVCRRCKGQEMKRRREKEGERHKELEKQRRAKVEAEPGTYFHTDAALRECPECEMKMWPRAAPIEMNFHSVRHTVLTLLLKAGVGMEKVQRIARHANISTTIGTYAHLDVEDLRKAMEALPPFPENLGALVVHGRKPPKRARAAEADFAKGGAVLDDGPYRVRTCDPYRVKKMHPVSTGSQAVAISGNHSISKNGAVQDLRPLAPNIEVFGSPVVHAEPALRTLPLLRKGLLTVKQVAAILGISTATVYTLCERGELIHGRISNAIRVDPSDLNAYVARSKTRRP